MAKYWYSCSCPDCGKIWSTSIDRPLAGGTSIEKMCSGCLKELHQKMLENAKKEGK